MTATRTQVYLTAAQRARIDEVVDREGVTLAEVVRRALDAYLDQTPDPVGALAGTFGQVPDLSVPERDEWDRG